MNIALKPLVAAAALAFAAQASAQITFYGQEGFRGRAFTADRQVNDFADHRFNDRASSVVVERGRWEVCEDARFEGRCVILRRGSYESLQSLGLKDRISSVRPMNPRRDYSSYGTPEPSAQQPSYLYRQRSGERLYEAPITAVRAVVGSPEQRCWIEKDRVANPGGRADLNVPGAIIGGVLGGILGHQIGGGSGKTVATIGGAVGGGALGANIDRIRGGGGSVTRDVRRCENVASTTPSYYDVTYSFRGVEHHAQMATQPGATITVNASGEPRT